MKMLETIADAETDKSSDILINLPHAKNIKIKLSDVIYYFFNNGISIMPINNRKNILNDFKEIHLNTTLDPVLRIHFLGNDSPYQNTMQAVTNVVDQLIATGLFTKLKVDGREFGFSKTVKAIKINSMQAEQYLKEIGCSIS